MSDTLPPPEKPMADITKQLADALRKLEQWVSEAADEDGASFDWHAINADEGAQARAALAAHDAEQAAQAVPAGFKLAPHYRGYALLGTGRYLIDSTDAPADPELGAELIISIASEKDREGREIGERRDMPARTIQPDDMAVRIGFANERGLFALEDQLWTLRQEHWPGTQSAAMLAAAPAAPAPEAPKAAPAGLYVGVIERLMRLSTRLGLANGDSIEHFAASLEDRLYAICRCAESLLDSLAAKPAAPAPEAQDSARTSPVHQPAHGWTDADADAARLALELECILTDRDTPMPLTSRWWESAHEALALHRQRIDDELREIECPPDPDAVDRALEAEALQDEAAAELRRLSAVEAERDALRAALTRVLDTHEREAKAYLTAQVASENFSRRSAKADEHAHLQAAVEASKAEKEARELLAAMKGTT